MKKKIKSLGLVGITVVLAACGQGGDATAPDPQATLPLPEVNVEQAPDPAGTIEDFVTAWSEGNYAAMHGYLSAESSAAFDENDFQTFYAEIDRTTSLQNVSIVATEADVRNPREAMVFADVSMDSIVVGPIERRINYSLVREGDDWRINWNPALVLPELAPGNELFMEISAPPRANILDRNGLSLAGQDEVVALWIVPNQVGGEEGESAMLGALSRLFAQRSENIQSLYDDIRQFDWRVPLGEVSLEQFDTVSGTLASAGGVQWGTYTGRYYPQNGLAQHAVGYVAQIQADELDEYLQEGYAPDAFVGQIGLEAIYEDSLRGSPGGSLYLLSEEGQVLEQLASRPTEDPQSVYTNIDRELQRNAQDALAGFVGSVVVLERDTGAVLAIASSPEFDPNLFDWHNPNSGDGLNELFSSEDTPLIGRSTNGAYPLGSVFKIITMAAALESEFYEPDTIYECGHEFRELQGRVLPDWTLEKELPPQGNITIVQALERSCNPYFFHIGLDLFSRGLAEDISNMAAGFGLGSETGIEISDTEGLVPGPNTKSAVSEEDWAAEDAVDAAIGQSFLQVTPIQVARFVAALGNGGTLYRPQLINRVEDPSGATVSSFAPDSQGELPIQASTLDAIQEGMVGVIRDAKGTARDELASLSVDVAGKTGTAQTGEFSDPHSWFAGYTFEGREDKPDIAVAVILENQGEGSEWAAPVFRRVVESYFFDRPLALYPWEDEIGLVAGPSEEDSETDEE